MSDLIDRIKGLRYVHVPQASQLFEEAIAEIERLRGDAEIARQRLEAAHAEVARLRLTDEEREAVEQAAFAFLCWQIENKQHRKTKNREFIETLRKLLKRLT